MNTSPPIDVAGPECIAAILADPANYAWRAVPHVAHERWNGEPPHGGVVDHA